MSKRYTHIPMSSEDREWVVGQLSQEAATNWAGLEQVDHWLVVEVVPGNTGAVEVYEVIGQVTPEQAYEQRDSEEGFPIDRPYSEVVKRIRSYGFPIHEFS